MQYAEFKDEFFYELKNGNNACISTIENNKKIILEYLTGQHNLNYVKEFLKRLNDTILELKKFYLVEKVINHPLLCLVASHFRQSDVLIRACRFRNKDAADWLLKMNINPFTVDECGKTALMYSVERMLLDSVTTVLLKGGLYYINMEDNNGNTALFHSVTNFPQFKKLIELGADYTHSNNDGDTILMYACKQGKYQPIELLAYKRDININQVNNVGKTLGMMLVEKNQSMLINRINKRSDFNANYRSKSGESLVTIFIHQYLQYLEDKIGNINVNGEYKNYYILKNYCTMLKTLITIGCNLNISIDGDGNTPIMFFLMIEDYTTVYYLIKNCPSLDLSIQNKYGVSASFLAFFINKKSFEKNKCVQYSPLINEILNHPTFDFSYLDSYNNNILIHTIVRNSTFMLSNVIKHMDREMINECNFKQENALIIATKLGIGMNLYTVLQSRFEEINVNHQDALGNTALFYAVKLKDREFIKVLLRAHADPQIQNNGGVNAIDEARTIDDDIIIDLLENPSLAIIDDKINNSTTSKTMKLNNKEKELESNEDLDLYIRNYRINQYQQEYDYLLIYEFISCYKKISYNEKINEWLYEFLFDPDRNKDSFGSMALVATAFVLLL